MKTKFHFNIAAYAIMAGSLLSSCSGSQKENDQPKESEATETKADTKYAMAEVIVFENVDPSVKAQINGFAADYFALNKTLIEDNNDAAKAAAKKLSETVGKFDMAGLKDKQMDFYHIQSAKLSAGLKNINESADIEEIRAELAPVSESIYALVKAYQTNSTELYYQFCPMARNGEGGNWLSETKEIINPYMGQRMLKCGKTEEVIAQVK